jgi:membrane carboxypeptidase/penicillin-binding protein PbpC
VWSIAVIALAVGEEVALDSRNRRRTRRWATAHAWIVMSLQRRWLAWGSNTAGYFRLRAVDERGRQVEADVVVTFAGTVEVDRIRDL